MLSTEINLQVVAENIKQLEPRVVSKLINDIARATKKKALRSGTQNFSQFCETIANSLTKQSTKFLIEKYELLK